MQDIIKPFSESTIPLEITLFSGWHFMYVIAIIGLTIGLAFLIKNKSERTKNIVLSILAYAVAIVYVADFFIMPLSIGRIDVDKLPFHLCNIMAIFVPFAQFNKKFAPIKQVIVTLSVVSSLMYITYPGTALGGVGTFSYKVMQTFAYHGVLFAWGFLNLFLGTTKPVFKKIWMELVGLCLIALWALLGNVVYSSEAHQYDWFFIMGVTFPFIPSWLMPFVVISATFGMCTLIYGIYYAVVAIINKVKAKKQREQRL